MPCLPIMGSRDDALAASSCVWAKHSVLVSLRFLSLRDVSSCIAGLYS
jgi:hypothetical protein